MTAVGRFAAPTYYSGQRDIGTGMMHNHNAAKALFAGFRFRNELPRSMHPFAGFNSGGIHFCLCRSNNAYASEASCTDVTPSMPISGVR